MKNKIFIQPENEEYGVFEDLDNGLVSWANEQLGEKDIEFLSVDFIKSFLDPSCFNNKYVWEDDDYLKENCPEQYLIKQLLNGKH